MTSSVWSEYDTAPRVPADLADQTYCPHDILPAQYAAFVDQIVPANLVAGQTFTYQVRFRNTGPDTWHTVAPPSTSTAYYAAVPQPIGSMTFGFNVLFLPQGTIIRPGEIFTINGQGTAPGVPGQYNFQLRMYQNGFGQFGAPSDNVVVTVSPP